MPREITTEDALRMMKKMGGGGGNNAKVTAESIQAALGYTPANKNNVDHLADEMVVKPITGKVGQILEIKSIDEDGRPLTFVAVDKPSGGGSAASSYDETTGELTIYGNTVVYDEETGNLTI